MVVQLETFTDYINGDELPNIPITLTLTADQEAEATSLTVTSHTFDMDLPAGARISIEKMDFITQSILEVI